MPWRKGQSGNPAGKPPGALNRMARIAHEMAERYGYDPLEKQIRLAQRLEAIVHRNHFESPLDRLKHFELLQKIYRDTMGYLYPALKSIEVTGDLGVSEVDERTAAEQREGLAHLLRQVRELADEQGVTEAGDAGQQEVA